MPSKWAVPGSPSRSGKAALHLPHGLGGCLCCDAEDLTCTIEMILVSTVLVSNSQCSCFYTVLLCVNMHGFGHFLCGLISTMFLPQGVDSLIPYISKHLVMATQADLTILLKEANPLITSLSPYAQEGLQALGKEYLENHLLISG